MPTLSVVLCPCTIALGLAPTVTDGVATDTLFAPVADVPQAAVTWTLSDTGPLHDDRNVTVCAFCPDRIVPVPGAPDQEYVPLPATVAVASDEGVMLEGPVIVVSGA